MTESKKTITLEKLAALVGGELLGNPSHLISGLADLDRAAPSDASFVGHKRFLHHVSKSNAGVILIAARFEREEGKSYILVDNPESAYDKLADYLLAYTRVKTGFEGIHPSAVIHPEAHLEENVTVGPLAVIDKGARIGKGSRIGAGAFIGLDTILGEECNIEERVVIKERCKLGNRVTILPGTVIGQSGYGFSQTPEGKHQKQEHFGTVEIGDDVEIGSNNTISRARFGKTTIGEGSKIDCLCEIGHNVRIGKHVIMVGHSAIGGSARIGDYVMMGAKCAMDAHLEICSGVLLRAFSALSKSITEPGPWGGQPPQPLSQENKNMVLLRNIQKLYDRVSALEGVVNI
ncbi:MAG: UDP-3-O-(3-hydroxymyristoyl)glucosamine N-acyltransferase [Chlamydiia bacterium]|nr:UDP-3-O-(3-hydroxymyristoyl)glucosamine N-acyltransferase [Chlamydiia bacterium]